MSTGKHSPSPWRVAPDFSDDHGQFSILCAEGCGIAMAEAWIGEHRAEATANARLIAAAPEMYEALKALNKAGGIWPDLHPMVLAAIAKAEGATP